MSPTFFQSCFYSDWPKCSLSLPSSAQMCQLWRAFWAAVFPPPQNYQSALSRSQKHHFNFLFLFFSFNGHYFTSSEVCRRWTFFTEDYESPETENTKELLCSCIPQQLVLTVKWSRLLGNPPVRQQRLLEFPHRWSAPTGLLYEVFFN